MTNLVHMTVAYSNAMLVVILPYVSDFAKKLGLDTPQPVTPGHVIWSSPSPLKGFIGAGLVLSNHYWFGFNQGAVTAFRSPDNVFYDQDPSANWPHYAFGKDNMTTNDAIGLARLTLRKLGYRPEDLHADGPPTKLEGPFDLADGHHVPHCRVEWEEPWETNAPGHEPGAGLHFEINLEKKTVTGVLLGTKKAWRRPPRVDVEPELESEYQKRVKLHSGKMFTRTNAPPRFIRPSPPATTER